jgi:hypothetical protein
MPEHWFLYENGNFDCKEKLRYNNPLPSAVLLSINFKWFSICIQVCQSWYLVLSIHSFYFAYAYNGWWLSHQHIHFFAGDMDVMASKASLPLYVCLWQFYNIICYVFLKQVITLFFVFNEGTATLVRFWWVFKVAAVSLTSSFSLRLGLAFHSVFQVLYPVGGRGLLCLGNRLPLASSWQFKWSAVWIGSGHMSLCKRTFLEKWQF